MHPPASGIIRIDLDPVIAHLGPIAIHWYGLMYVLGIVAGLRVALPYAEKRGMGTDRVYELFWPILIAALVGGRLYYVVQSNFGWYLLHPAQILATWEGGMAFYGAIFAGLVGAYLACRRQHLSFATTLDVAAVAVPLTQAIGRVGNIINGDILGYPSSLPWATEYTNPSNTFVPSHYVAYQPAAAYELLFSLALFCLIWLLRFRFHTPGALFVAWLVLYSVGQFGLFFARANTVVLFGLKQAQVTALIVIALSIPVWLVWRSIYAGRSPAQLPDHTSRIPGSEAGGQVPRVGSPPNEAGAAG